MFSKNDTCARHLTINSFIGGALLFALLTLVYAVFIQPSPPSSAISTPVNALVCSGGYRTPAIIDTTPSTGTTVTHNTVVLNFTADWVTSLSVKSGATTLATVAGNNQSNESLSATVFLAEGQNDLTITIQGGCPSATSTLPYTLVYVANAANVTKVQTSNRSPRLFGFYKPMGVTVYVEVAGKIYQAIAKPDLTWELPAGTITPDLPDGIQSVRVFTMDSSNTIVFDQTYPNAILIDTTPPTVAVTSPLDAKKRSPEISGTTNDPQAIITVMINNQTHTAINNRDGTWRLPEGSMPELSNGTYPFIVVATDLAGNIANTSGSLHIDAPNQAGFVLAPNTGYLRVGTVNIQSSYLYSLAVIIISALIGWFVIPTRHYGRRKKD